MSNYFNFKSIALFFSMIFFMSSCNDDGGSASNTSSSTNTATSTDASPAATPSVAEPPVFGGRLDILIAERTAFTSLPDGIKLVYSHNFGADNKVHLKGWQLQGNRFPGATMELENGAASNETYGSTTYFGNVVLMPDDVRNIKNELAHDANLKYVLFFPHKVDNYFIGYIIYTSITKAKNTEGVAATAEANPSPPRLY
jgi:hypothetical protein